MKIVAFALAFMAGLWIAAPQAAAQQDADPVASCRAAHGADAAARITCLEAAIARMQGRVTEAEQHAAEAQQQVAQAEQRAESGRPAWSLPGFRARQDAEAGPQEARVQLVRIRYGRDGYGFFTTSEGQVWRETVAAPARRHLDTDQTYEAVIRSGMLGYRMHVDGIRWEYKVEPLN
ncbi:MAG: hypothetical protein NVV62_07245 [Terricaulis sp.]|nr:hypothetical protein [Terricaulis sp.]